MPVTGLISNCSVTEQCQQLTAIFNLVFQISLAGTEASGTGNMKFMVINKLYLFFVNKIQNCNCFEDGILVKLIRHLIVVFINFVVG